MYQDLKLVITIVFMSEITHYGYCISLLVIKGFN